MKRPSWSSHDSMSRATAEEVARNPNLPGRRDCVAALVEYQRRKEIGNPFAAAQFMTENSAAIAAGHIVVNALSDASPSPMTAGQALAIIEGLETL